MKKMNLGHAELRYELNDKGNMVNLVMYYQDERAPEAVSIYKWHHEKGCSENHWYKWLWTKPATLRAGLKSGLYRLN